MKYLARNLGDAYPNEGIVFESNLEYKDVICHSCINDDPFYSYHPDHAYDIWWQGASSDNSYVITFSNKHRGKFFVGNGKLHIDRGCSDLVISERFDLE